ncbi:hypothetical protein CHH28_07015 [Bacterioplanes sanyensis]|uniref:N-acetyltransferase domain-containing protein n=1 Tax=Bacterioplanes sanyensis TaxID=1249553 RepID=A0A222FH93_9GAMM|nr:GNAT family N-acetyltransferase [Bacterioplanes sanyensis]ASP38437.1 hypothetical protein CHH28_07015 [Bacterioplanes sanyensis]
MNIRPASRHDIAAMHRIRMAVTQNKLTSSVITEDDYIQEIEYPGRGWVVEDRGNILGFGIANQHRASIWALFVDPLHEGKGYGKALLKTMVDWLFSQGERLIQLCTEPDTRAEQLYLANGWHSVGLQANGNVLLQRRRPGHGQTDRPGNVPVLVTERLTLRPWRQSDAEALAALNADEEFVRYLGGQTLSAEDSWRVLAVLAGHWALKGYGFWAVEITHTGEFIGRVGLWQPHGWPGLEIGWGIAPSHWGQGYATEAARASLAWGFQNLDTESIISVIHPENQASKNVALRLGESFSHRQIVKNIECDIYRITREEFTAKDRQ